MAKVWCRRTRRNEWCKESVNDKDKKGRGMSRMQSDAVKYKWILVMNYIFCYFEPLYYFSKFPFSSSTFSLPFSFFYILSSYPFLSCSLNNGRKEPQYDDQILGEWFQGKHKWYYWGACDALPRPNAPVGRRDNQVSSLSLVSKLPNEFEKFIKFVDKVLSGTVVQVISRLAYVLPCCLKGFVNIW